MDAMDNKIPSLAARDELIKNVLDYYVKLSPKTGDTSFKPIVDYKRVQVYNLLGDDIDFSYRDLMKYLSCPLDVEKKEDITSFGIRNVDNEDTPTANTLKNGVVNMALTEQIFYYALLESMDINPELDEAPTKLNLKSDYLKHYSTYMLDNTSLLVYLFMTGRGKEFTEEYGDPDFLLRLEGKNFTEDEIEKKVEETKNRISANPSAEFSPKYKKMYAEDLKFIKSKLAEKTEELEVSTPNKTLKGA